MFSARGVALNVTTASVQLRVLHNSVYLSARLKLRGTNLYVSLLYLTLCLSLMEPLPRIAIFVIVSSCSLFRELPLGPNSFPTKLNCNKTNNSYDNK
jgi:hypothetical protein